MNNKTTKNNHDVAPTQGESALQKFDLLSGALAETGRLIPESLASERALRGELGGAEIDGSEASELRRRLADTVAAREAAARRRASACEGLLSLEPQLAAAREAVARSRAELSESVIQQFVEKWNRACRTLVELRSESEVLARTLGQHMPVTLPFTVRNGVHGVPELKLSSPSEPALVSLPPGLSTIVDTLARLDGALSLCASVRQGRELTTRLHALNRQRGTQGEVSGVFTVVRPFTALGSSFAVHQLVDASLLPVGLLERFWKGRDLRPLEGAVAAA
jgi:hypothetical protein